MPGFELDAPVVPVGSALTEGIGHSRSFLGRPPQKKLGEAIDRGMGDEITQIDSDVRCLFERHADLHRGQAVEFEILNVTSCPGSARARAKRTSSFAAERDEPRSPPEDPGLERMSFPDGDDDPAWNIEEIVLGARFKVHDIDVERHFSQSCRQFPPNVEREWLSQVGAGRRRRRAASPSPEYANEWR